MSPHRIIGTKNLDWILNSNSFNHISQLILFLNIEEIEMGQMYWGINDSWIFFQSVSVGVSRLNYHV